MNSLNELMSMKNKVVLVTGGAGYLGKAMCETLAELGARIIIASRSFDRCDEFCKELNNKFNEDTATPYKLDILDMNNVKECVSFIEKDFGRLDVLINNAWSGNKNTFESISYEDWDYDIDMCLNSVFKTTKEFFELLKASKGVILNTSSMYGHVAPDHRLYDGKKYANPPSYGVAKAGVIQLTKYLASFLSPYGIRANSISPGPFPFPEVIAENKAFIERLEDKTMLGRIGTPDDLKGATALLCSDASKYMTGQNICVDGGWAVW